MAAGVEEDVDLALAVLSEDYLLFPHARQHEITWVEHWPSGGRRTARRGGRFNSNSWA